MPGAWRGRAPGRSAAARPQYYCCKTEEPADEEDEPDFAAPPHLPPLHSNRNLVLSNGPAWPPAPARLCRSCSSYEPPSFCVQEPDEPGARVAYRSLSQEDLGLPAGALGLQALNPNRLAAMREAFSRSRSVSTDV